MGCVRINVGMDIAIHNMSHVYHAQKIVALVQFIAIVGMGFVILQNLVAIVRMIVEIVQPIAHVEMAIVIQQNHVVHANRIVVHAIVQYAAMEPVRVLKVVWNVHMTVDLVGMYVEMVPVVQLKHVIVVQMIVVHAM